MPSLCPQCNQPIPDNLPQCPLCQGAVPIEPHTPILTDQEPEWEYDWKTNPLVSFINTTKKILLSPVVYFQDLPQGGNIWPAIFYAVICSFLGTLASVGFQAVFSVLQPALFGALGQQIKTEDVVGGLISPVIYIAVILGAPLMAFIGVFVGSALYHVCLILFKGAARGFDTTLKVYSYTFATSLLLLIPLLGGLLSGLGQIILMIIGFKEAHQITLGKSIMAVLLPLIVCCCGVLLLIGGIGSLGMLAK